MTKPNTFRHNQPASVASLRRLFAFPETSFGFPLESLFTFTGISTDHMRLRRTTESELLEYPQQTLYKELKLGDITCYTRLGGRACSSAWTE